jgi:hypothetical protein
MFVRRPIRSDVKRPGPQRKFLVVGLYLFPFSVTMRAAAYRVSAPLEQ